MIRIHVAADPHDQVAHDNFDRSAIGRLEPVNWTAGPLPSEADNSFPKALRRQPNNCDGAIPASRAIAETFAPGASVSATSRAFASSAY